MKFLLINGSPRRKKAHYIFATTFKQLAEVGGHEAELFHAIDFLEGKKEIGELKKALAGTDTAGLFSPLYVDYLPYPVIKLLEGLAGECREELNGKQLFAVCGCGFPDLTLFKTIYGACACFAGAMGMTWLGGMGYVAAPMQDGKSPAEMGKRGKAITEGLQMMLDAVLTGRIVPPEAEAVFSMKMPGPFRYLMAGVANYLVKRSCKKLGTDLYARPHAAD